MHPSQVSSTVFPRTRGTVVTKIDPGFSFALFAYSR
jgi:hypothetical protein